MTLREVVPRIRKKFPDQPFVSAHLRIGLGWLHVKLLLFPAVLILYQFCALNSFCVFRHRRGAANIPSCEPREEEGHFRYKFLICRRKRGPPCARHVCLTNRRGDARPDGSLQEAQGENRPAGFVLSFQLGEPHLIYTHQKLGISRVFPEAHYGHGHRAHEK